MYYLKDLFSNVEDIYTKDIQGLPKILRADHYHPSPLNPPLANLLSDNTESKHT